MAVTLILVSTSIALVFFFVAELGLGIIYPEKVLEIAEERRRVENLAYVFHPEYLIALKRNIKKITQRDRDNGGESHWNDAGQDPAARETANYIQVSLPRLGR